jgi:hypothetical protein
LSKFCVPLEKPKSDSDRFINILIGKEDTDRPPVVDYLEDCAPGGRFAVGAGNSIANYVPIENNLTMLDEALG